MKYRECAIKMLLIFTACIVLPVRRALEKAIDEEDLMDDLKEFKKLDKKSTAKDDEE